MHGSPPSLLALPGGRLRHQRSAGTASGRPFDAKYLAKTDVDRIADATRAEVVGSLMQIADKALPGNPKEWKKAGLAGRRRSRAGAAEWRAALPPELEGRREGPAAMLAFRDDYAATRWRP